MVEWIFLIGGLFVAIGWMAGIISIFRSDNIRFVKLFHIFLSFSIPPYAILYLLRNIFISDIKSAPKRLENGVAVAGYLAKESGNAAINAAKWLSKK